MSTTTTADIQFDKEQSGRIEVTSHTDTFAPFSWLGAGLNDFKRAPGLSLLYGTLFALAAAGVFLLAMNVPWYAIAYLTGLVVLGPFMASGLYAASSDMERGIRPSIRGGVRLLMRRATYLALFSLMLSLVMAAWIRISALVFAVKFNTLSPSIEA